MTIEIDQQKDFNQFRTWFLQFKVRLADSDSSKPGRRRQIRLKHLSPEQIAQRRADYQRQYQIQYRSRPGVKEAEAKRRALYFQKNKERIYAIQRLYDQTHREKRREIAKRTYLKNRAKRLADRRAYYLKTKEKGRK